MNRKVGLVITGLSLLLGVFLGGSLRFFTSSNYLTPIVKKALMTSNLGPIKIELGQVSTSFRKGWFPDFSLSLDHLKILFVEGSCNDQAIFKMEGVTFPISLFHSIKEKTLTFSRAQVKELVVNHFECDNSGTQSDEQVESLQQEIEKNQTVPWVDLQKKQLNSDIKLKLKAGFNERERILKSLMVWQSHLKTAFFHRVLLEKVIEKKENIELERVRISLQKNTIRVDGALSENKNKPLALAMKKVLKLRQDQFGLFFESQFSLLLQEKKSRLDLNLNVREGRIHLEVDHKVDTNEVKGKALIKNLPFNLVQMEKTNLKEDKIKNLFWIGGSVFFNLNLFSQKESSDFDFSWSGFQLDSRQGYLKFKNKNQDEELFPIDFKVSKVSLKKWLNAIGFKGVPGTFNSFGVLDGDGQVLSEDSFRFTGDLFSSELNVINDGKRLKQKIDRVKVKASLLKDKVSVSITDVQLSDGQFDGDVSFDTNLTNLKSKVSYNIKSLKFPPPLEQILFWDGTFENLSTDGIINFEGEEITSGNGKVAFKSFNNDLYQALSADLNLKYSEGKLYGSFQSEKFQVKKQSPFYNEVQTLFFNLLKEREKPYYELYQFHGDLSFWPEKADKIKWSPIIFRMLDKEMKVKSFGFYESGEVSGSLDVLVKEDETIRWMLEGTLSKPKFRLFDQSERLAKAPDKNQTQKIFENIKGLFEKRYKELLKRLNM